MTKTIEFEEWLKCDLRVGKFEKGKIDLGKEKFELKQEIDANEGDEIVVGLMNGKIIIPLAGNSIITPEKDIENGSRIG